jgi:hypothetical protein
MISVQGTSTRSKRARLLAEIEPELDNAINLNEMKCWTQQSAKRELA